MKIFFIVLAIVIALFGLKLLLSGIKAMVMLFKMDRIPMQARQTTVRDFTLGILFIALAIAMIT